MINNTEIIEIIKKYIKSYNDDDLLVDIITDIENHFSKEEIEDHYKLNR